MKRDTRDGTSVAGKSVTMRSARDPIGIGGAGGAGRTAGKGEFRLEGGVAGFEVHDLAREDKMLSLGTRPDGEPV